MDSRRGYLQKKSSESTIITIVHNIIFHLLQSPLWWEAVKQRQGLEAISVQPRLTLPLQQCICTPLLPHSAPQCHTLPHTSLPHTIIATQLHTCFLTISVCSVHVRTLLLLCSSHTLTIYPPMNDSIAHKFKAMIL